MKLVKIEELGDGKWTNPSVGVISGLPVGETKPYEITYKITGNKHHTMVVFATNEVHAIAKAEQAWETNQMVRALQTLAKA